MSTPHPSTPAAACAWTGSSSRARGTRHARPGGRAGAGRVGPPPPRRPHTREGRPMKATETLHERGQSLWPDNITRGLLDDGTIKKFIDSYSVTGLTSNPSIFDKAIGSGDYDDAIRAKASPGLSDEDLFFELAVEDLVAAAHP